MSDIALNGMTIQLRLATPHDLVFSVGLDKEASSAKINEIMDMLTEVADREKLKGELERKRQELQSAILAVQSRKFERAIEQKRRERADYDMARKAAHLQSGRRGEIPRITGADKTKYVEFDQQIQLLETARRETADTIPMTQYDIDCLYARIAGQPVPEMPENVRRLVQNLDLPESVGFAA